MKAPKYSVQPGHVSSKIDGDWHYVGAQQLMRLYGVDPRECIVMPSLEEYRKLPFSDRARLESVHAELIALTPRYNGDYSLPQK